MKKLYFLLLSALVFAFASCSKDQTTDVGGDNPTPDQATDYVYLDVALNLPTATGTRSGTDDGDESKPGAGVTPSDEDVDYEIGYDYENAVNSLILVIADKDDKFLLYSAVNSLPPTQPNTGSTPSGLYDVTGTAKFSRSALKAFYDNGTLGTHSAGSDTADQPNPEIHIYAFCNYTADLERYISGLTAGEGEAIANYQTAEYSIESNGSWLNKALSLTETANGGVTGSIWGKNAFLMTNAEIAKAQLPETMASWNNYTSESNPFKLSGANGSDPDNSKSTDPQKAGYGPIKVERAAARFDFKDGSITPTQTEEATYPLKGTFQVIENYQQDNAAVVEKEINLFTVKLTTMSLVNMSKGYFALRRVSNDGTKDAGEQTDPANMRYWRIGKYETASNYVVDTDFSAKAGFGVAGGVAGNLSNVSFNFPLFDASSKETSVSRGTDIYAYNRAAWSTSTISQVLGSDNDTWTDERAPYKIWRYLTENTIPKADNGTDEVSNGANQKAGISTGIVFTGRIVAGTDADAVYAQDGDKEKGVSFLSAKVQELLAKTSFEEGEDDPLYLFNGLLYANLSEITKAAYDNGVGSREHNVLTDILKNWYLEYSRESADQAFNPETATTGTYDFVYSATEQTGNATTGYLPLTVEIYYALTDATTEFDTQWKEGVQDGDKDVNLHPDYVWKAEDTYHKAFITNKDKYTFDGKAKFDETSFNFVDLAVKNFTIYRPTDLDGTAPKGYYCYYFYWNRHNDNGNNSLMGPMEFATVRNNVYKLSVTKIGKLGHPTIPTDDPDPIVPDTPDEDDDVYMSVELEVLPWVVRVNDIEF